MKADGYIDHWFHDGPTWVDGFLVSKREHDASERAYGLRVMLVGSHAPASMAGLLEPARRECAHALLSRSISVTRDLLANGRWDEASQRYEYPFVPNAEVNEVLERGGGMTQLDELQQAPLGWTP